MSRQRAISLTRSPGVGCVSAVRKPSAPALATAEVSSARPTHCMPPCTMGCSTPNISVNLVRIIAPCPMLPLHSDRHHTGSTAAVREGACSRRRFERRHAGLERRQAVGDPGDDERRLAMSWQQLLYKAEDRVATITLNRPDRLNAYTQVMSAELREAFAAADADDGVRAIVLTGAGRGFCAGADMERLSSAAAGRTDLRNDGDWPTEGLAANFAQRCSYVLATRKPVIAGIN